MNKKLAKTLFKLSIDSRVTTKDLGKYLRISQQSASYSVQSLFKKNHLIDYQLKVDPAKFGLINVMVLYNYINLDSKIIKRIKKELKDYDYITRVEEVTEGADLLIEFTVPNLSLFNKINGQFLFNFKNEIKMLETYVVIVKHEYEPTYLINENNNEEIILSGDRYVINFDRRDKKILKILKENPKESIINIAKEIKIDPKTVITSKKQIEQEKIIRKYSVIFNYEKLGINRRHIFIRLDYEDVNDIKKFVQYTKQNPNIVELVKLIGPYEIMITVEKNKSEKIIINDIRKMFKISKYKIINSVNIIKQNYIPTKILD